MDFFLIGPALVVIGLILVHLALRSGSETSPLSQRPQNLTRPLTLNRSRVAARRPAAPPAEERLADALTQLSTAREEVQQLRASLEALQKQVQRPAKPQTRRVARTSTQGI